MKWLYVIQAKSRSLTLRYTWCQCRWREPNVTSRRVFTHLSYGWFTLYLALSQSRIINLFWYIILNRSITRHIPVVLNCFVFSVNLKTKLKGQISILHVTLDIKHDADNVRINDPTYVLYNMNRQSIKSTSYCIRLDDPAFGLHGQRLDYPVYYCMCSVFLWHISEINTLARKLAFQVKE